MNPASPVHDWPTIRDEGVILEDDAILVLNKPAGISVMGERHDTDLVRLAKEAGEQLLPVHRIDKVTSGAILFAKTVGIHGGLTRQFNRRSVHKAYLVVTRSTGLPERGTIDLPLSVGRKSRVRVAALRDSITADRDTGRWSVPASKVFSDKRTYPSLTAFARLWEGKRQSLLVVRPLTGRRHQIRVHLAWIGHPIQGDPLFDKTTTSRTFLHSWRLGFDASWADGTRIQVEAEPGPDFWKPVRRGLAGAPEAVLDLAHQAVAELEALDLEPNDPMPSGRRRARARPPRSR